MIEEDWERESLKDSIYLQEEEWELEQSLLEQLPAIIIKHEEVKIEPTPGDLQ